MYRCVARAITYAAIRNARDVHAFARVVSRPASRRPFARLRRGSGRGESWEKYRGVLDGKHGENVNTRSRNTARGERRKLTRKIRRLGEVSGRSAGGVGVARSGGSREVEWGTVTA